MLPSRTSLLLHLTSRTRTVTVVLGRAPCPFASSSSRPSIVAPLPSRLTSTATRITHLSRMSQPDEATLNPEPVTAVPSTTVTATVTDAQREASSGPSRTSKAISKGHHQSVTTNVDMPSTAPSTSTPRSRPLNGVFGLLKPSGPTSMSLLESLKPLFAASSLFRNPDGSVPFSVAAGEKSRKGRKANAGKAKGAPKIGQGGTLDPLADGVLVVGVGSGTKKLGGFLECTKEYRTTALLGSATTSYDSQEPILFRAPFSHVKSTDVSSVLSTFRGPQKQLPPLYSAVRIDGKRLFEYARNNEALPRPVEARDVRVEELELVGWFEGEEHGWREPETQVGEEEKRLVNKVRELAGLDVKKAVGDGVDSMGKGEEGDFSTGPSTTTTTTKTPPAFTLSMTVSSGTYVRSIVHDVGLAVGSAAHVVVLTRTRQGEFVMGGGDLATDGVKVENGVEGQGGAKGNCIPWSIFEKGIRELEGRLQEGETDSKDEDGLREWERWVLDCIRVC